MVLPARAQLTAPVYSTPSPDAATLGTFGTVPVGHFTGTPQVSIPLYELTTGKFSWPLGVAYHLASVKPNLPPGSVGLGWVLSSDACISRTVRGVPDEKMGTDNIPHGYFDHASALSNISNASFDDLTQNYSQTQNNSWFELSADEFSFSLPNGLSGNFYLNPSGEWTVVCDQPVSVEFDSDTGFLSATDLAASTDFHNPHPARIPSINDWPGRIHCNRFFAAFTLIGPDGTRYTFGGADATDFCIDYYGRASSDLIATAWHISCIETPDGRTVSFSYRSTDRPLMVDIRYVTGYRTLYNIPTDQAHVNISGRKAFNGFLLFPALLETITTDNERAEFTWQSEYTYGSSFRHHSGEALFWEASGDRPSRIFTFVSESPTAQFFQLTGATTTSNNTAPQNRAAIAEVLRHFYLHRIAVCNLRGGSGRSFYFDYDGLTRRRLSAIRVRDGIPELQQDIVSGGGVAYPFYTIPASDDPSLPAWDFRYNTEKTLPVSTVFPQTDAWGYWAGGTRSPANNYSSFQKQPSLIYTKAGTLQSICWPTGGYTVFDYELHTYSKQVDPSRTSVSSHSGTAGGLRVRSITEKDSDGSVCRILRYTYAETLASNVSSGICVAPTPTTLTYHLDPPAQANARSLVITSEAGFSSASTAMNNPDVGYSCVIEEVLDPQGNSQGWTRYRYSNFDSDIFGLSHPDLAASHAYNAEGDSDPVPVTSNAAERGLLLSTEYFDTDGTLLRRETRRHARLHSQQITTATQQVLFFYSNSPGGFLTSIAPMGWLTQTITAPYLPSREQTTDYTPSGTVNSESYHSWYTDLALPARDSTIRSDGSLLSTSYTYPSQHPDSLLWMTDRHILNAPVSVRTASASRWSLVRGHYDEADLGAPFLAYVTQTSDCETHPKTLYRVLDADPWGNPTDILVDSLRSTLDWGMDGQVLLEVSDDNALTRSFLYNPDRQAIRSEQPARFADTYSYGSLGKLVRTGVAAQGDNSDSGLAVNTYAYSYRRTVPPPDHEDLPTDPIPVIHDEIPDHPPVAYAFATLEPVTGYSYPIPLEYRSDDYEDLRHTNALLMTVENTLSVRFSVSDFDFYHEFGDSLATGFHDLQINLYHCTAASGDTLFAHLPFLLDGVHTSVCVDAQQAGADSVLVSIPPGDYLVLFEGLPESALRLASEGWAEPEGLQAVSGQNATISGPGGTASPLGGGGGIIQPDDPGPVIQEDPLEGLLNFPRFTLVADCLPLLIPEPELEPEPEPVHIQRSSIATAVSRDGTESNASRSIAWVDGLGRDELSSAVAAAPDGRDILALKQYDAFGRPAREWLPTPAGTPSPGIHVSPDSLALFAASFYGAAQEPFSYPVYEPSPLGRITASFGPGASWHSASKAVRTAWYANVPGNDTLGCRRIVCTPDPVSGLWTVSSPASYPAGTLHVTRTRNEDGQTVFLFQDLDGRTVLSRRMSGSSTLDTYYAYDPLGNLLAVLPPAAATTIAAGGSVPSTTLDRFAYLYLYDGRDRLVCKKLPGAEPVRYVYDDADRVILSQDGNARARGQAVFSLYDVFGRSCVTGICSATLNGGERFNSVVTVQYTGDGPLGGYVLSPGLTLSDPQVLTVNWYDSYDFLDDVLDVQVSAADTTLLFSQAALHTDGLQTGSWTTVLGQDGAVSASELSDGNEPSWSVLCYDRRGRPVLTLSSDHLGGRTVEEADLSHRGSPLRRRIVRSALPGSVTVPLEEHFYTYDNEERLVSHSLVLGASTDTLLLASNAFDPIGRLASTDRGSSALLHQGFSYNLRSWVTSISGSLFSEKLAYQTPLTFSTAAPRWGGSISAIQWNEGLPTAPYAGYDFAYDPLGRLTSAAYWKGKKRDTSRDAAYAYDSMGNVTAVSEAGSPTPQRTYSYDGNHLAGQPYDANGNRTADPAAGIARIRYNLLGLPALVVRNDSTKIHYGYSAAGAKLSEQISLGQTLLSRTDYSGSLVLHDGLPERILTDEGTLEYTPASGSGSASWQPRFFLRDHLGSVRVIADASGTVLQRHHFYPYGADLDALFASGGGPGGGFIPADSLIIIGPGIGGNGTGTASPQGGGLDGGELIDGGDIPSAQTSTALPYRFSGKERLDRAGLSLYDFGARWYNPATPAWTTPDPLAEKYYDFSPYAYCAGDPVNMIDPNGGDAIYITFPKYRANGIPFTGHAGVLLIDNKTGLTKYYEYGRYDKEGKGIVRNVTVSDVVIGKDGRPTIESLNKVMKQLSYKSGHRGDIEGAYIISDKFKEMNDYAKGKLSENSDPERKKYSILRNNCATFAEDVITQDKSIDKPRSIINSPINIVSEYQEEGNARVQYKSKDQTTTIGIGNEKDAKTKIRN